MSEPKATAKTKPYTDPQDEGLAADRISFSVGRKISDGKYGSYDFHCSMSTDVRKGENPSQAALRCMKFAEGVVKFKVDQGNEGKLAY